MRTWILAGAVAAVMGLAGCRDRDESRPIDTPKIDNTRPGTGNLDPATGGSGYDSDGKRIGDGKIGNNNGVIDDGEGPLEGDGVADDKIGDNPGVWNDGEGPFEKNENVDRPESQ
jgi:hypothetical protein